ncbi:MAG TPA: RsmE family RNA methyltransferase [Ignavibacteria bacterium]|nr:RsmE family RNA methyltransferase [Ignavibacteria bacterium]
MEYYVVAKDKVNAEKNELIIDGNEYRHLAKVLRKKAGDLLTLTDGELNVYFCKIINIDNSHIVCEIESKSYDLNEPELSMTLFIAPLRNMSRFEFLIEKAVELGVKAIQPVLTEHTVVKFPFSKSKIDRFIKIISAAMSQSQRCYMPEFRKAVSFSDMLKLTEMKKNKVAMYELSGDSAEINFDKKSKELELLIGPEGGFSEEEALTLIKDGWQLKSLGKRKLRAETAAVVSIYDIFSKYTF